MNDRRALNALRALLRPSHLAGADDIPGLVSAAGAEMGASRSLLYVVDYEQVVLVPLLAAGSDPVELLPIEGTVAGRVFSDLVQHPAPGG